jgi:hypothetical protein
MPDNSLRACVFKNLRFLHYYRLKVDEAHSGLLPVLAVAAAVLGFAWWKRRQQQQKKGDQASKKADTREPRSPFRFPKGKPAAANAR